MTEPVSAPPPSTVTARMPRRTPWRTLFLLVMLALLAIGAVGAWKLWQLRTGTDAAIAAHDALLRRLGHQLGDAESEIGRLRDREAEVDDSVRKTADAVSQLTARADEAAQAQARLDAVVQGGRARAQLVTVEQLLTIANDRARLAHDPRGAAQALDLAQERLGGIADPRLFEVRKAIAEERAALLAMPQADTEAVALGLTALIGQAPRLTQRAQAPQPAPAPIAAIDTADATGWAGRGWAAFKAMLQRVFLIRRSDRPVDRLLPPEQEALVGNLLLLKLESARLALLRDDTGAFRGAVREAAEFLGTYYRGDDAAVQSARNDLERLRDLELDATPPDLSRSLVLLRGVLDAPAR